ncbi:MAG TPA: NUDIX hydrolase [Mycobacteriales bacterium]|nr:NUDIX hydrolase [Mycobacteriales bacterium]
MTGTEGHTYPVLSSRQIYQGRVFGMRADEVEMPGGRAAVRELVVHPGAVVVAAVDASDRVVMVHQYRHPVRDRLWELPAGLLDVDGEPALLAARRELYEEAHVRASRWQVIADVFPSPGMTDEAVRLYLARELTPVADGDRFVADGDEEAEMTVHRIDLDDAVRMVFTGELHNGVTVSGVLAAARLRDAGWPDSLLRPPDSPWPARPTHAGS